MANKLMVFDDDKDIQSICTYIFKRLGWEVYPESDCSQLLSRVRSVQPDVILMDNWIPNEGGVAATRLLKQEKELMHIPVIYFSANRDVENLAAEAGADTYIQKPFDLKEFEEIVMRYGRSPRASVALE